MPTSVELAALDRARQIALAARGDTEPNPQVGCVLLRDDVVVGEGRHAEFGGPHAEIGALAAAGEQAAGSTAVVTLEPCSTTGKTGPCCRALLAAGVVRVVVGAIDPNPAHAGRGLTLLRGSGVEVEIVDDPGCLELVERFERALARKRPHVLAKWAMSRDGGIAGPGGETVRLSGPEAEARVHRWRRALDGILVGVQTIVADDPLLTARGELPALRPLHRIVLDPTLRTPRFARVVTTAHETPTWLCARDDADEARAAEFEEQGVRVLRAPAGESWLPDVLATLRLSAIQRVMVEGGARTLAAFLEAGLVDQVAVLLSRKTLGVDAVAAVAGRTLPGDDPQALASALALHDVRTEVLGEDMLLRGERSVTD
ncbi:MAG: bifunctional diaminohydroxyphosphoribosylaminopyrimidine deaminase/5-amino-6-(5-phosphoribosylamino)uracil reductase RibD [Planctomycetes bacterium]|nr:bifunctional diaminohydroxyphosphoribosylaminopyrimidine deaminase/5-amino-6-(5-phosphoribosylamino)uracil reductase RibD [Planctomycetota bacterium]